MREYCLSIECSCFNLCFWISTFIVPFIVYLVLQKLRPRLKISKLEVKSDSIKVTVTNQSRLFFAHNLRVEMCLYNDNEGYTYHLKPDHDAFLILPSRGWFKKRDNAKVFVSREASYSAKEILKRESGNEELTPKEAFDLLIQKLAKGYKIRFRCHAEHSLTGLGRSFEQVF